MDTGQFQEYCQTWYAKLGPEKTWTKFHTHFIEAQADLPQRHKTSLQGGYSSAVISNNAMDMSMAFSNLEQATA